MAKKKIIIIGSGFGGLASALRMKAKGFEVTLVEKLIKNSLDKSKLDKTKLDKIYLSSIEETKLALKKKPS